MSNNLRTACRRLFAFLSLSILIGCSDSKPIEPVASISPQLEEASKVTEVIGAAGGSVIMTDSNGLLYTLDIPPLVLPEEMEISMTPVMEIPDLRFADSFHVGVQFEPEGLLMVEPAILTVTPPAGTPVGDLLAFGWEGEGESVYLEPIPGFGGQLQFPITHFSGTGVGEGDAESADDLILYDDDLSREYLARMAAESQNIWQRICTTDQQTCVADDPDKVTEFANEYFPFAVDILAEWFNAIDPNIDGQPNAISGFVLAQQYFVWEHQAKASLCGSGVAECDRFIDNFGVLRDTLRRQVAQALVIEFQKASEACDDERVFLLLQDVAFIAGGSLFSLENDFIAVLGIDASASVANELQNRYSCHLVVDVQGWPDSLIKGGDWVDISVQISNKADVLGVSLEDVGINFSARRSGCGSVDGANENRLTTDASGEVSNVAIAAETTCTDPVDKVVIYVTVEDNVNVADPDQFFLGREMKLEADAVECAPAAPVPSGANSKAFAPDVCAPIQIAFSRFIRGELEIPNTRDIYVINDDGTGLANVTDTPLYQEHMPAWSPDRTELAFVHQGGDIPANLYVVNADGTGLQQMTFNEELFWDAVENPSWSPDGSMIAYSYDYDILIMNSLDGGVIDNLTDDFNTVVDFMPDWSPDGTRIAFTDFKSIQVINVDGTDRQSLTDPVGIDNDPAWSPDGTRIAFSGVRDGTRGIFVVDSDGTNLERITDSGSSGGFSDIQPAWSPDGTKIAFSSDRDRGVAIFVVDVATGVVTQLTFVNGDDRDLHPTWR